MRVQNLAFEAAVLVRLAIARTSFMRSSLEASTAAEGHRRDPIGDVLDLFQRVQLSGAMEGW